MKAYLTRIDTPFAKRLAERLKENGYTILSGDDTTDDAVELFVATENDRLPGDDYDVCEQGEYEVIMDSFKHNLFSPVLQLERLLPNLDKGRLKRICFLSTQDASVNRSGATKGFGLNMSKAALGTTLAIFKNKLFPDGYTFRLYDPMEQSGDPRIDNERVVEGALTYFLTRRAYDRNNARRDDETRLVLRDALGRECPY